VALWQALDQFQTCALVMGEALARLAPLGVARALRSVAASAIVGGVALPTSLRPMQPELAPEPFHRPGWVYEEKYDGWRIVA
jgi:ATP-dependent DNA ligase